MTKKNEIDNLFTLNEVLEAAEKGKYAVGAFSARYIPMILPILKAGERANSLLILQISEYELDRYNIDLSDFAAEFFRILKKEEISIPVVLHLDHTREFKIIKKAIKENFTSVMIDASSKTYEENTAITKKVVEYAEKHDVSVEAELGQIGSTDTIETEGDEELFTDPGQAQKFVSETGVDALAVSVGTAHGVYNEVTQPSVDYERIKAIKKLTPVHLVLHGGSGVPSAMVNKAAKLPGGGISKVNIATDLELAFLEALDKKESMTNIESEKLDSSDLKKAQKAVEKTVIDKIKNFLESDGSAPDLNF